MAVKTILVILPFLSILSLPCTAQNGGTAAIASSLQRVDEEREKRTRAAMQPVETWYLAELAKLAATIGRDPARQAELEVLADKIFVLKLQDHVYRWTPLGGVRGMILFDEPKGHGGFLEEQRQMFKWAAVGMDSIKLTLKDGKSTVLVFSKDYQSFRAVGFDGKGVIVGDRLK